MIIFDNLKKRQVLGNFLTFKWQFCGGSAPDLNVMIDKICVANFVILNRLCEFNVIHHNNMTKRLGDLADAL